MIGPFQRLRRSLSHTRVVESGNYPLYRFLLVGTFLSSVVQLFTKEAPVTVNAAITVNWGDWLFIGFQALAAIIPLCALYAIDGSRTHATRLHDSLSAERFGLIIMLTVISINVVAVAFYYDQPPSSQGTWLQIMFALWILYHLRHTRKTIKELSRKEPEE